MRTITATTAHTLDMFVRNKYKNDPANLTSRTTLPFIYPVSEVNGHLLPMS